MSVSSEKVKRWRKNTKERMVESMGGECQSCGYKRCNQALELHHIDPVAKELSFGKITASPIKWEKIVVEMRKCILLCSNCHKELHAGVIELPNDYNTFDESFANYREKEISYCPVCGGEKSLRNVTCSKQCAGSLKGKVDWSSVDLLELKKTMNNSEIAEMLDITETSVRKRLKKISEK